MATAQRFEDLEVWQMSRTLENKVFIFANAIEFKNDFDLIRQMRRSSGSIMDNIAEGFGRSSRLEFINALSIAKGEVTELQSQLYRSADRGYLSKETREEVHQEAEVLSRKIGSFMNYLNNTAHKGQKFLNR